MSKLKVELIKRLEQIPGVTHKLWPDRSDGFSTLHCEGKEFGHFHNFNELDLRLGKKLIKLEGLMHYSDSVNHPLRSPNSQFIELRFKSLRDLDRITRLVERLVLEE